MAALNVPLTVTDAAGRHARHAVGVHILLQRRDRAVLVGLRSASVRLAPRTWSTPCGNLEAGETAPQAAARETREELGVRIEPDALEFCHLCHFVNDEGHGPAFSVYFRARTWIGEPRIMEPTKCDELRWVQMQALPSPFVEHGRSALAAIRRADHEHGPGIGGAFSLHGWPEHGGEW